MTDIPDARLRELIDAAKFYDGANGYDPDPREIIAVCEQLLAAREALAARSVPAGVALLLEDVDVLLRFYDKQNNGDILDKIASYRAMLAASPPGADNAQVAPLGDD